MEIIQKTEAEFRSMGSALRGDIHIGSGETDAMKQIARIFRELHEEYPGIRYHLRSGKSEEIEELVDKGILDFGVLIQPVNISKYDYLKLPFKDLWGVIMRKDSPLAAKRAIGYDDLRGLPLICSRQIPQQGTGKNGYPEWFGKSFSQWNVVATYNLIYNAAQMVEAGLGYAIGLDKTINTTAHSGLCFRPLTPRVESELVIIWKKYQIFSSASEIFLSRLLKEFPSAPADE